MLLQQLIGRCGVRCNLNYLQHAFDAFNQFLRIGIIDTIGWNDDGSAQLRLVTLIAGAKQGQDKKGAKHQAEDQAWLAPQFGNLFAREG